MADVYHSLTAIYAISPEDKERFESAYHCRHIEEMGDTKFDQVQIRKEQALNKTLIPRVWKNKSRVLILGSIWPEDESQILDTTRELLSEHRDLKLIVVPHQPTPKFLERISGYFDSGEIILFTALKDLEMQRIILVDIVGVLADLYRYGDIAYVGGSFKQGIHNVMEPAIYDIPVIYGPVHRNSFEAIRLNEAGGSIVINSSADFRTTVQKLLTDSDFCTGTGQKAGSYAKKNLGATDRILSKWEALF
jgi:3-deoxy-D-manno-octulosonic-acid transferase